MKYLLNILAVASIALGADERILPLGTFGSVRYTYDDHHLLRIDRLEPSGEVLYTHSYSWDQDGRLVFERLIGNLGTVEYIGDRMVRSPYNIEICTVDDKGNRISSFNSGEIEEYAYNEKNELLVEEPEIPYVYDENGNLFQKGGDVF